MNFQPYISIPALPGMRYGVFDMSMPSFPPNGADMTREEALTMIIASIAMEELALSHILNAEGEKLQYILGTLPGSKPCATPQDVLAVNKSVTDLVEAVTQNQMLLKNKLAQVLEFCPRPCPPEPCPPVCPPPCPPEPCPPSWETEPCESSKVPCCGKSALQLVGQRDGMLWEPGCRMSWRLRKCIGKGIRWEERSPAQLQLDPKKAYAVQYTLNVCAASPAEGTGTIRLKQSPGGGFSDAMPLRFSMEQLTHGSRTLRYAAVLYPQGNSGCETSVSLVLDAPKALCVERAVMDVAELW